MNVCSEAKLVREWTKMRSVAASAGRDTWQSCGVFVMATSATCDVTTPETTATGRMPVLTSRVAARMTSVCPAAKSHSSGGVVNEPEACDSQPISNAPATGDWRTFTASQSPKPSAASAVASNFFAVVTAGTPSNDSRHSVSEEPIPPTVAVVNVRHSLCESPSARSQLTRTRRVSASTTSVRRFVGGSARIASSSKDTEDTTRFPLSFV